jgi:hypothetical protein
LEHTLQTYVHSHCNMCNIPIYFCNTNTKHMQRASETFETQHMFATCTFSVTSPCYFEMEAHRRMEFTSCRARRWSEATSQGRVIAVKCGSRSGAALHFFEHVDGASHRWRTDQGTPQPSSGPGQGATVNRPGGTMGQWPKQSRPLFLRARQWSTIAALRWRA